MINLLPPEIKKEAEYSSTQKEVIVYGASLLLFGIVAVGIQLLGYVFVNQQRNDLKTDLDAKNAQLEEINKSQSDAVRLSEDIKKVGALLDRRVDFSALIQEVGAVLPSGTRLNSLSLGVNNSDPISLQFDIDTQEKAAVVRKNLEDSEVFTGADIQNINTRETDENGNAISFSTGIITKFSEDFLKGTTSSTSNTNNSEATQSTTVTPSVIDPSEITLTATNTSSGFLFWKSSSVDVSWTIPSTAYTETLEISIMGAAGKDPAFNDLATEFTKVDTLTGTQKFELNESDIASYKFQICGFDLNGSNDSCVITSNIISIGG